jgi:tetratricopeptide (TPR) repeat protein
VTEVTRSLAGSGRLADPAAVEVPETVRVAIVRRLGQLSAACREALVLAALFGRDFQADALARASGLGASHLLEVLEEAASARIVGPLADDPGRWRFTHALYFETLAETLGAARRAALHRRAAEALVADPRAEELAAQIAHHWLAAGPGGDPAQTVAWARRAGDRALGLFAHEEAVRLYGVALTALRWTEAVDAGSEAELVLALGEAHKRAGEPEAAKAVFLRTAAIGRRERSVELLTRAALGFAPTLVFAERPEPDPAVVRLLEEAIAAWEGRDAALHARALARLGAALYFGDEVRRGKVSARAVAMARRVGDAATLRYVVARRLFTVQLADDHAERLALARELVDSAEQAGDLEMLAHGRLFLAGLLLAAGDLPGFTREAAALRRLAGELRQPIWSWYACIHSFTRALVEGRFDEAESAAGEGLAIGERAVPFAARAYFAAQMLFLRVLQGRAAEAVARWRAAYDAHPDPRASSMLLSAEVALGDESAVRGLLARCFSHFHEGTRDEPWLVGLAWVAEAIAFVGDASAAIVVYDEMLGAQALESPASPPACAGALPNREAETRGAARGLEAGPAVSDDLLEVEMLIDACNALCAGPMGGSSATTRSYMAQLIGAMAAIYRRDVRIVPKISQLVIWTTAEEFAGTSTGEQITNYRNYNLFNRGAVLRDLAHYVTSQTSGGIAYLGGLLERVEPLACERDVHVDRHTPIPILVQRHSADQRVVNVRADGWPARSPPRIPRRRFAGARADRGSLRGGGPCGRSTR